MSYSYGQKNSKYIEISFSSICCGTPSSQALIDEIKKFQTEKKLNNFEIWVESGLGDEGEYSLYIGLNQLNNYKKEMFLKEINNISETFNNNRNNMHDGYINVGLKLISTEDLNQKKLKPRTKFSKISPFKY